MKEQKNNGKASGESPQHDVGSHDKDASGVHSGSQSAGAGQAPSAAEAEGAPVNPLARWSYWIKSGLYSLFERFSLQLFGLLTLIILIKSFGEDTGTFGTWVLYLMVGSFLEVGRNGLIQNGLVKFLATADQKEIPKIQSAAAAINLSLTLITGIALYFSATPLARLVNAPELAPILPIYVLTNLALMPFAQANFTQQANLSFRGIFLSNFSRQGLFFGYVAYTWISGGKFELANLAWAQCITSAVGSVVSLLAGRSFLHFAPRVSLDKIRSLLRFGVFTFGTSLSTMLYKTIDRIMLGILMGGAGTAAIALIDPAIRITNVMEIPLYAMAAVLYPQSARRIQHEGRYAVKLLYEKSVGATLALVIPICVVVFAFPEFFIRVVTGGNDAYLGAVPILRVTILYTLFVPYGRQFGTILDSIGRPYWSFFFVLTGALLNIASNYIFIKTLGFGVIGAAYGTLTTLIIKFLAQQVILYRVLGVETHRPLVYAWTFIREGGGFARRFLSDPAGALQSRRA